MQKRNLNYDLIRLLGLFIIIIAHASPPDWLFQLRNFGTPLLIIGSGLTYSLILSSQKIEIKKFYRKRFARLVFPAWIFLSFFFLTFYFVAYIIEKDYPFSCNVMIDSYIFMGGIGFVWIFKIYLMLALLTPAAIFINNHVDSNFNFLSSLVIAYIIYELLLFSLTPFLYGVYKTIFNSIVFTLIAYTIIYLYAFRLARLKRSNVAFIAFLSLAIFVFIMLLKYNDSGSFVQTQHYKYPPSIYYLSYAFFAINLVYLIVNNINLTSNLIIPRIVWLSSNSLWIYLWHIFAVYLWIYLAPEPSGNFLLFLIKAAFLFSFGILFTFLQNKLVTIIPIQSLIWKNKVAPLLST